MAYGNWGGKVWCDGQACHDACDTTPERLLTKQPGYETYWLHYIQAPDKETLLQGMYHAVIGDAEAGVLVLLYKNYLSHVLQLVDGKWVDVELPESRDEEAEFSPIPVGGIFISWCIDFDPAAVHVEFTDAKGRKWRGLSGYGVGEGFEDWT